MVAQETAPLQREVVDWKSLKPFKSVFSMAIVGKLKSIA